MCRTSCFPFRVSVAPLRRYLHSIRSPGFAGDESGPKRRPREVERPELGSCSGTYGMGDLRAVQPFLVSPQNEGLEVLALVFLPVPGPDTGHELRPPQKRLPNLSLSLNERPCCWVLAVGLLRVQVRDSEIRSTHMVIRSASTMSCRAASLERPERNTPSPACVRSGV